MPRKTPETAGATAEHLVNTRTGRELGPADIDRLAYRRALAAVASDVGSPIDRDDPELGVITRPDPRQPDPALRAAIVAELLESGRWIPAPEPAPAGAETTPPAEPATTPEG
jgi:hypothetical protein